LRDGDIRTDNFEVSADSSSVPLKSCSSIRYSTHNTNCYLTDVNQ